ncbi:transporter substrate-binding domain-containing protein [Allopusillimonas soli]|uniref:Transporter substrate-binding domain-containing protein n=1 Tax=Allopusillimonas soli TaxID=659016 RepID=A0A853FAT5_9BURK|nr:transporter substrate-binding domain-containing protein [Allopusillimonas soli]NYT37844.1 transporter substrate-binding domain-containing protein [Allopusillimonas soli]TEA73748.1 transporter substrate-binding domain-containing protein [Allopusillimonas soli]
MKLSALLRGLAAAVIVVTPLLAAPLAQAAGLLDTVKERGALIVGLEGTYPPFNYVDAKTGELDGFDVDVAKLIAERLGVKAEFVKTEWSAILAGLGSGKFDVIVNQVGITDARKKAFDFSVPYVASSPQLILRKDDDSQYKTFADLKGKKLGVGQGSNYEALAKAQEGVIVKSYPGAPEYLSDLVNRRIDAALNDQLMTAYLVKTANLPIRGGAIVGEPRFNGIPFRKGNPKFEAAINKALQDAFADGSFARISTKWFGIDVSKVRKPGQ